LIIDHLLISDLLKTVWSFFGFLSVFWFLIFYLFGFPIFYDLWSVSDFLSVTDFRSFMIFHLS
jgi:hypothetical protein